MDLRQSGSHFSIHVAGPIASINMLTEPARARRTGMITPSHTLKLLLFIPVYQQSPSRVVVRYSHRFIPSSPNSISPIPSSPEFFPFCPFFFGPFQVRPFPILPSICPALLPFHTISFSPIFHFIQKSSHLTFPLRPFPTRPLLISPKCHFFDIWAQN